MLETINDFILMLADPLLNWLLVFPLDAVIFIVAILTSAAITFSRKWVTDQEWLKRADDDVKRIKEMIKEAKQRKDKEAIKRHKMTIGLIKMRSMKFELKPLLLAILPILILATWGFGRLGFYPPEPNETVKVKMYIPKSGMGEIAHMLPAEGVDPVSGWVQKPQHDTYPEPDGIWEECTRWCAQKMQMMPPLGGVIIWRVKAPENDEPYELNMVYDGETYTKELLVGQRTYGKQMAFYGLNEPVQAIEFALKRFKLFGVIGGFGPWFPPWMVAYLIIACIFVPVLKKTFKIY